MRVLLFAILLALTQSSLAQGVFSAPGHNTSQYAITEVRDHGPGLSDTTGKTSASSALTPGEKTAIAIVAGQSLSANQGASLYTPTNAAKCQQLNIYDGALYRAVDPVLGAGGATGTWMTRWCDLTINAGTFQRVILVPIAISGTSSLEWRTSYLQRMYVAVLRLRALGYLATNSDLRRFVMVGQGEQDSIDGTTSAQYQANWIAVQSAAEGLGWDGNWFFARETMSSNTVYATIQGAQDALPDGLKRKVGANTDSLTGGTNRQGDGTHLTDTGNQNNAALWQAIIAAAYP